MAAGDLSADQARFRDGVMAGLGLDRDVVTAWIGAESGWNITKPDHNYLNVGPGRNYPSTDAAVSDTVKVAKQDNMHIGGSNPKDQLLSIIGSQWEETHYGGGQKLIDVYNSLGHNVDLSGALGDTAGGDGIGGSDLPSTSSLIDWTGLGGVLDDAVNLFGEVLLTLALGFVFTSAALGLIVLGISRLTGKSVSEHAQQVMGGAVKTAAIAAV